MNEKQKPKLSRRGFLIAAGVGGAGVLVGVKVGVPFARLQLAGFLETSAGPPVGLEAEATAWFQIKSDNAITLYIPKAEMGQGVHTALAQIAAEELEIEWGQLEVVHSDTGRGLDDPVGTSASNSVSSLYQPLREAAAVMREMLRIEAARILDVSGDDLIAGDGRFTTQSGAESLTYGEVVQNTTDWELPEEVPPLKPVGEFNLIGKSKNRVDLPAKIQGTAIYGYDVRLPGMLYGAVAHPTDIGARLVKASPGKAPEQAGVVQVVIEDGFAGVVADTREHAYAAVAELEIEWEVEKVWQQSDLEDMITVGQGDAVIIQRDGNPRSVFKDRETIKAEYRTPMAFHAYLEPLAATVDVQPDAVHVWVATQSPVRIRDAVAEALGREKESVTVTPTYLGGGFGRKIGTEAALEAARLSMAIGSPVHVGWNRREDFRNGFVRPLTHHVLQAALDDSGKIEAIEHHQASGEVAFPFLPDFLKVVMGADFAAWRGAFIHYDTSHKRTVAWLSSLPVPTGWWRGLGLMANIFAIESFVDEVAHEAGADPLEFRLQHLPEDDNGTRLRRVIEKAAARAGWGDPLPEGHGRGIALCADVGTIIAEIAEVSVLNGEIRVNKVTAAVDPGLIINPDGATAQALGAITMGLSATLIEEVTVEDGKLSAENFDRYPLLRMNDVPEIDIELIEGDEVPHGMGEPPIGPVAAAVANAVYAATGQRLRSLPLRLA